MNTGEFTSAMPPTPAVVASVEEWDLGEEYTGFRGNYQCENCYEDYDEDEEQGINNGQKAQEEAYAAAKRTSVEMESEDGDDVEVTRREERPRKARKGSDGTPKASEVWNKEGKRAVG